MRISDWSSDVCSSDLETLAKLDELLVAMADDSKSEEEISAIDREFHMTIAAASSNKAIIHVIESLWRMRMELPEVRSSHSLVCRKDGAAREAEDRKSTRLNSSH